MIIIFIRTLLLYFFVLVSMRIMGPGELSQMQPFQFVVIMMIAELAALPMENTGLPLINGFIAIFGLIFAEVVISFINLKSNKARSLICGKPSLLINKGSINEQELKRLRINIDDLLGHIRSKEYHNIADVEFAILETNGDLSIIPKPNKRSVNLEDLNLQETCDGLPVSLILDGYIDIHNLKKLNLTEDWLKSQLESRGYFSEKQILLCYIDANKNLYFQQKSTDKE